MQSLPQAFQRSSRWLIGLLGFLGASGVILPPAVQAGDAIVDVTGNVYDPNQPELGGKGPQRVVSTCLTCDEIILGILKQAGKSERLIAVSKIAEDPRYSNITSDIGAVPHRAASEIESIIGLRPDIVFISEFNRPEFRAALQKAKVRTFALGPFNSLRDTLAAIETTSTILGEKEAGRVLKQNLLASLEEIRLRTPKKVRNNPSIAPSLLGFAPDGTIAGSDTPFDGIVRAAGGVNLAVQQHLEGWQRVSAEKVATLTPDWIVVHGTESERAATLNAIKNAPGWKAIPAVREGRIIFVPTALLLATSHHVTGAIDRINRALFPPVVPTPTKVQKPKKIVTPEESRAK